MLDHSPLSAWEVIPNRNRVQSVHIILGNDIINLRRVDGYQHRGGVNNSQVGRWLNNHYHNTEHLTLLFDVSWDLEANTITYKLIGKIDKI